MTQSVESGAAELVAELRNGAPDLVRLGEVLSLAAYVETPLLRRARLVAAPKAGAELEGQFWFSPLVETTGTDHLVLHVDIAEALRLELQRDPAALHLAHDLVSDAHRDADPAVRLFEDLVRRSLVLEGDDREQLGRELLRLATTMAEDRDRARDVARWVLRHVPRLPARVRDTDAALAVQLVAADLLGVEVAVTGSVSAGAAELVSSVLPAPSPDRVEPVGVRLVRRGVALSRPPEDGAAVAELAAPSGILRIAAPSGGLARHVRLRPGSRCGAEFSHLAIVRVDGTVERSLALPGRITAISADRALNTVAIAFADGAVRFGSMESGPEHWQTLHRNPSAVVAVDRGGQELAIADGRTIETYSLRDRVRRTVDVEESLHELWYSDDGFVGITESHTLFRLGDPGSSSEQQGLPVRLGRLSRLVADGNQWAVAGETDIFFAGDPRHLIPSVVKGVSNPILALRNNRLAVGISAKLTIRSYQGLIADKDDYDLDGELRWVDLADNGATALALDDRHELLIIEREHLRSIPLDFVPHRVIAASEPRFLVAGSAGPLEISGVTGGPSAIVMPEAVASRQEEPDTTATEDLWFRRAVFYDVPVRAFADSNGDGCGDLRGLAGKLDYLEWLGVDCLQLGPIMLSPLRDGGYDVSDFRAVLPELGTFEDLVHLLDEAHKRGIRVTIDLVLNHTSDAHPWFQESRSDPTGPYGDFYVWSDDDTRYADARIILVDTETSNWTSDPERGQYYWHRYFWHEPDLNYENPEVQEAMLDVMRFWLDLGIDGFRLDAVPYLFEQEGTNCENLPRTHEFLKRCRAMVDREYPGRALLAGVNQWPADVVEYFGEPEAGGDECHLLVHSPVMPRVFMAVRRENRMPISEILAQTPPIPSGCQWGIVLRNHDELTLEMVTDEERDYMYAEYAKDPRMRANIGIRRRLAPMLENDRNQLELFSALLLSLPGSPILYYGDEIGMGDNVWLGDRDGVRTPMQWSPDRNAGFSTCDPNQVYLPVIADAVFGYQAINVEAQTQNNSSLLNWIRLMISIRRRHPAFGLGTFAELGSSNLAVLAYRRRLALPDGTEDVLLCVMNLSRFGQAVELDLREHEGMTPFEMLGGAPFPVIGEPPYVLTMPGHGFYWFQLVDAEDGRP